MAFSRPSLSDLVAQIQNDFISRLSLVGAVLRRSVVYVFSRVYAGAVHLLFGYLDYQFRQLFPDTAELTNLLRWGTIFGVLPNAAAFATGNVSLTGTNGSTVLSGAFLRRSDGTEYKTTASATIASGTATVPVQAKVAALAGDCDAGTVLSFESPVAGVDASATVATGGLSGGADPEATEPYRSRVMGRIQSAPSGGNANDYVTWTKQISGVTRAWCYPNGNGVGSVVVRFMRDNDVSPIPTIGEVATVQAYLNTLKPVTAAVLVVAPVASPVSFTLHVVPNTPEVQAAATAELKDLLLRDAAPGVTLLLSAIRTAIGTAEGLTDYTLTTPAADVTFTVNQIATLGTVTYV